MSVVIETTIGDITVDLFTEERPVACLNFIKLCKLKYYNFNLFHTVEQGFIAQTGDPSGSGDGGSSVWGVVEGVQKRFFEAESLPKIYHSSAGLLSLVSAGKNMTGSQFFFTLADNLKSLDGIHCVIGEVVEGHETLRALNEAIVDDKFRPFQDIRITHTVILNDPFADPRGFQVPSRSPSPSAERLQNGRIAADEDIDDTDGKSMQEIQEMLADREAKARATILEIVGDLPDADMAPPENVLFVCKLNPVTTDDDLEIIFSRFGKVKQCEVIRDKKTGESLQYAFVEFEEQSSCEAAYFKMDNVLIDDRRIHVDFSQSVARIKWRGKGRGVDGDGGRLDFNNLREPPTGRRNERRSRDRGERNGCDGPNSRDARMTSEERRRARVERHREQAEESKKNRHRSRSRSLTPRKDDRRRYDDSRRRPDRFNERRNNNRRDDNRYYRADDRRRERSRSRSRGHEDRRRNRLDSSARNDRVDRRRYSPERRTASSRRSSSASRNYNNRLVERNDHRSDLSAKSSKRPSPQSFSEDSESDSEPSSSDSSSSSEDRHKKKKTKKSKKDHKSRSSKKKKSKKHKK